MNSPATNNLAERAQACLDMGDLPQAIKLFDELRTSEPDNAEAWLMTGALLGETGSAEEAMLHIEKAISINPNYPEAHLTMAHLYKAKGANKDCYDVVKQALEIDSNYDEAWVLLGAVCCDLNRFEEAENASREAIQRWPENAQAHLSLATALCNLNREFEAEPEVRQAIKLEGGSLSGINPLLARILLGTNDYEEAETLAQAALAQTPNDIIMLMTLANIKLGQKDFDQAEHIFHEIISITPDDADAWASLGSTYQKQFNLDKAEECYKHAIGLDESNLAPAYLLGQLQEINGQFDDAEVTFRNIVEKYPGQLDTVGALAGLLEKAGKGDDAIDTIEPVLSIAERSVPVALVLQKLCDKMNRCDDAMNYLNEVLQSTSLQSDEIAAVRFAIGELFDKQGAYDEAFEQFNLANEIHVTSYKADDYTKYISNTISVYSESNIKKLPIATNKSQQPIFIIGMPRSGTSLVEQILSSHTDVFGAGELRNVTTITEGLIGAESGKSYPESIMSITQDKVDSLSEYYLSVLDTISNGALRVIDKLPHNFQYLGLIHILFPYAKIIHCRRNSVDTCLSCYSKDFFGHHPYTSNLVSLGRHYNDYERLMTHWKQLEIPMYEIQYEDLVNNPEKWSKQLIDYCDLDWQDQCLRFYENNSRTRTASYDQVRRPVYTKSVNRWKHYEAGLKPLIDVLKN